ncbi:MAG: PorP/SprF family type IX secretion system membrane protein [Cyclobacteriaceae bacterium]|nr:PorP/SprF family type IX secretion system membrane protein [Cyclobacteriaceae bacterium]
MANKYTFIIVVVFLFTHGVVKAQDPVFSQFYAAPLYLNPALSGAETSILLNVSYRRQWQSLDLPYDIGQFTFNYPLITNTRIRKHIGGIGLSVFRESSGVNRSLLTMGALASGAFNWSFDRTGINKISIGLQAGFIQKSINFNNFEWSSQYDPFLGFQASVAPSIINELEGSRAYPTFNAGVLWSHNPDKIVSPFSAFVGVAASNLNKPNESLVQDKSYNLPMLFKFQGGLDFHLTSVLILSPNVLILRQNETNQFNVGTYLGYNFIEKRDAINVIQIGVWHRVNDSFIFSGGFTNNKVFVGISFDFTSSTLRYDTRRQRAYEISISYKIPQIKGLRRCSIPLL